MGILEKGQGEGMKRKRSISFGLGRKEAVADRDGHL
jgi:hypothetical protein